MAIINRDRRAREEPICIQEERLEYIENKALEKANIAISSIENAMAIWESTKEKPDEFHEEMELLREKHGKLTVWVKEMIKAKRAGRNERARALKKFVKMFKRNGNGSR
jgi:hypothetical protein